MEVISSLTAFLGGLAMFVYGMHIMAEGLQQTAGEKTKSLLEKLTNNRLLAVALGAVITAVVQSSSATTVLVVGFVNAQIMNLTQAVGVIMGANIGTTMTGWIVSMSEWGAVFKPETFAPLLLMAGCTVQMFSKRPRLREAANILIGFGLLFIGLSAMSDAVGPYADSDIFYRAFAVLGSNPFLGILTGAVVTALVQSSSASMGILQTLAVNGVVGWGAAVYIALGQNIGTCVTAVISCTGASRNAKRAAAIHLLFNLTGTAVIGGIVWLLFLFMPQMASQSVTATSLALFHTVFNIAATVMLLPFADLLVKASRKLVPDPERRQTSGVSSSRGLDERLLTSPTLAILPLRKMCETMAEMVSQNIDLSCRILTGGSGHETLTGNEAEINRLEKDISTFLCSITAESLPESEQLEVMQTLLAVSHLERISDHCVHIADLAQREGAVAYSPAALDDLRRIGRQCRFELWRALRSCGWIFEDQPAIPDCEPLDLDRLDACEAAIRKGHLQRLMARTCSPQAGIVFMDAVNNYRQIADHIRSLHQCTQMQTCR